MRNDNKGVADDGFCRGEGGGSEGGVGHDEEKVKRFRTPKKETTKMNMKNVL